MALTPFIQAMQGRVQGVIRAVTPNLQVPQARSQVIYNIPTKFMHATQAKVLVAYREVSVIEVQQARVMAVVRGRVANPKIRVFTFTLDEHDFYVVRLGDKETLVFDTYSQQWPAWSSKYFPFWRANCGINWLGAQHLAPKLGSNIVVGDDTWGLLWFLDPNQAFDDAPDPSAIEQQQDFTRITMGQVTARGRENIPCYALFLDGDNYGLSGVAFTPQVTMSYSDDQGVSFWDDDTLDVNLDPDASQEAYMWTSGGQISSPGRLFRITDNGVFSRIDSLEMNDDG